VIVDGYQFDAVYQLNLKSAGVNLLLVDDTVQCEKYFADIVLNQNVDASEAMYRNLTGDARLLLGSRYALLRREFWGWRDRNREIAPVGSKVLIAMGGSDAENITVRVIEALRKLSGLEVEVVVGGSNPHWESLQQSASRFPGAIELRRDVPDMSELMAWADMAISAAGGTCYELALLQVPMLVITVAENQQPTRHALTLHGAAIDLGSSHALDAGHLAKSLQAVITDFELRQSLATNARRLVDVRGAQRAVEALLLDGSGEAELAVSRAQVSAK
jgi:UDP-2,4-diacetamido-2,4,6-trideoxy-beta-L-altropyranose hydrolase